MGFRVEAKVGRVFRRFPGNRNVRKDQTQKCSKNDGRFKAGRFELMAK